MSVMFRPLSLSPPPALDAMAGELDTSVSAVGSSLAAGAGSLGELGLPPLPPLPPLPGESPPADLLRNSQNTLLSQNAHCLLLSPYDYGMGQRRGEEAWLTPSMAVRALSERLGNISLEDVTDGALLLVLAASVDQAAMATALQNLNTAFPLPELQKLERRARGVARLDRDKFVIPEGAPSPAGGLSSPERLPLSRQSSHAVGALLAMAEGREALTKAPGDVLASFGQRQAQKAQAMQAELAAIAGRLSAAVDLSAWWGLYLEGAAAALARLLADMAPSALPVDEAFKCASALCWYGKKDEVAYYKELFGL